MRSALALARRGLGRTAPNPSVGCVIVKDGVVISRARTDDLGRPHAESLALEQLSQGQGAQGSTLYVTLEPCTHYGETSPCVQVIIDAKVVRVVIGILDRNPVVSGKSLPILKEAGIEVEVMQGQLEEECAVLNAGFFNSINEEAPRPYVTLKTACSLDGKIAMASGESQWITGEYVRKRAHLLRASHDAVLVGIGTVLKDDPMLSARIDGLNHDGVRIVLDTHLRTPQDSVLVKSAYARRLWVLHGKADTLEGDENAFIAAGVQLHEIDNIKDISAVLALLAKKGVTRLLVEGGARLHASFLRSNLYDELVIYRAPSLLGEEAKNVSGDFRIETLAQRHDVQLVEHRCLGVDAMERYKRI
ncbi:MAG: bifunctional diaminohydroxyphosphoribosylaminopyrimidine deaminase/5-amino-6-(5-phosphoribosylamino)uracil reductase RibD [Alphaproteobacteria bacterium]|nr:bifunctional diaminohydroxyphosphoribosylaminopyrimidine deaminase/5-amino-6-(5-phosphoribosylamino)uracil reductase RibD [Alphaproteobacteria bacterium]